MRNRQWALLPVRAGRGTPLRRSPPRPRGSGRSHPKPQSRTQWSTARRCGGLPPKQWTCRWAFPLLPARRVARRARHLVTHHREPRASRHLGVVKRHGRCFGGHGAPPSTHRIARSLAARKVIRAVRERATVRDLFGGYGHADECSRPTGGLRRNPPKPRHVTCRIRAGAPVMLVLTMVVDRKGAPS